MAETKDQNGTLYIGQESPPKMDSLLIRQP